MVYISEIYIIFGYPFLLFGGSLTQFLKIVKMNWRSKLFNFINYINIDIYLLEILYIPDIQMFIISAS